MPDGAVITVRITDLEDWLTQAFQEGRTHTNRRVRSVVWRYEDGAWFPTLNLE